MEKEKNLINKVILIAIILAIVLVILNNFMLYEIGKKVAETREITKERLRPAELQLIKIISDCDFCFDIDKAIGELKNQNVNITTEETFPSNSAKGKELIAKYEIKKLPTILVSGEINKSEQIASYFEKKGEIKDNTFIYTSLIPPYFNTQSEKVDGIVSITFLVDSSCKECVDLSPISSVFKEQGGVFIQNEKFIEYNSKEGQELIQKFEVKEIPAIIISKEIDYYTDIKNALIQSGAKEKEGSYAVHSTTPPYRDLSQNKIIGLVDVIYLTNIACKVCYDVKVTRNVLVSLGITFNNENTYDIDSSQGKELIKKYSIIKVPILIVSPDAEFYPVFLGAWKDVGSVENDGWFVMRNPEVIGTYWDLERNKVVQGGS